jgi:hypothetical protein
MYPHLGVVLRLENIGEREAGALVDMASNVGGHPRKRHQPNSTMNPVLRLQTNAKEIGQESKL